MQIDVERVADSEIVPDRIDVAIIGAGIIGVCAAYELARRGASVAVFDKGIVAGEQSGRNWGWVRQQNRDLHELPLAMFSLRRWGELASEIGRDLGFRRTGILYASNKPEDLARWEDWGDKAREMGFKSELQTRKQLRERTSQSATTWLGGVWSPTDGGAEPSMATPAIAEGAKLAGARIFQNCAVRGLEIHNNQIDGVWTERGLVRADRVILAGGAWSSRFCRRHGIELPIANIGGTAARTSRVPEIGNIGCLSAPGFNLRRRLDGGYTITVAGHGILNIAPQGIINAAKFYQLYRSNVAKKITIRLNSRFYNGPEALGSWSFDRPSPFEKVRILEQTPDLRLLKEAVSRAVADFPDLTGMKVIQAWGGVIDTAPDLVPVISKVSAIKGLILATGFSGHGFALGPGAGRLIAELTNDEQPFVDPTHYRLDRFSDGSKINRPEMF